MATTRFDSFETKAELVESYVRYLELGGRERKLAEIMAKGMAVYVPHRYRGGWVIRGFGFSTERIGKYVPADRAGSPGAV